MLDPMAYGQQTQHNPTDFVAPHRLGLIASNTAPLNPNLTLHNGNTEYVLWGLKKLLGVPDNKKFEVIVRKGFRKITNYCPEPFRTITSSLFIYNLEIGLKD